MSGARYAIIQAIAYLDTRLSPRDLTVLGVLGAHADKSGYCWPSGARLGEWLGISRQAAQKSIAHLLDAGYIQKHASYQADGGQTNNRYRVLMDHVPDAKHLRKLSEPEAAPPATSEVAPPATSEVAPPATSEVAPPATPEVALTTPLNDPIKRPPPPTPSARASAGEQEQPKTKSGGGGGEDEKNQTPKPGRQAGSDDRGPASEPATPPDLAEQIIVAERWRLRKLGRELSGNLAGHIRERLRDGPPTAKDHATLTAYQAAQTAHQRRREAESQRVMTPDTRRPEVQAAMRQALDALPPGLRRRAHHD